MARRLDRRVQRTRKLLRDSLMALILEEGFDTLSIQDITDHANVGRATFYLHYKDKDELLLDVIDQFIADFLDQVPQLSATQWRLEDSKVVTKLFDFAAEHYDLYRILIIGRGGITAARQLQNTIAKNIQDSIEIDVGKNGFTPLIPADFLANHLAGSLLAIIYWWLDNDLPYSVEEMALMFQKVSQLDRETVMGMGQPEQAHNRENNKTDRKKRSKDKTKVKKDSNEAVVEQDETGEESETAAEEEQEQVIE